MAHQNPAANMTLGEIKSGKGEESLAEQAVQTHEAGRQLPARRTYMRRLALWSLPEPQFRLVFLVSARFPLLTSSRDSLGTQLKELATLVAFPATIWVPTNISILLALSFWTNNLFRLASSMA